MEFGERIKNERCKAGLRQVDLAELVGVTQARISAFERNKKMPDVKTIEAIAKALDITVQQLCSENQKEKKEVRSEMEVYRGDIFWVGRADKYRSVGCEIASERPAVIISNDKANKYSPVVEVVYLTTQEKKPLPTHVTVKTTKLSTAMCEQIHTVSKERLTTFVRTCTAAELAAIDKALMVSLGMTDSFVPKDEFEVVDKLLSEASTKCQDLMAQLEEQSNATTEGSTDATIQNLTFERDFYKKKYEELLAKLVG